MYKNRFSILCFFILIILVGCKSNKNTIGNTDNLTGDTDENQGVWNVYYDASIPIAGFQFKVNGGNILNASGGASSDAGLSVTFSSSMCVAFSLSATTIPPGSGILVTLDIEGDSESFCISDLILSDPEGNSIDATISNCNTIKYPH